MRNAHVSLRAATGVLLIGAALAVLPSTSSAAPPPAPSYECTTAAQPKPGAVKIMIAGDSITNSSAGDYTWPYWLWQDQAGRGAKVDFVGQFKGTFDLGNGSRTSRAYLDCDFDQDKEALSGVKLWTKVSTKIGLGSPTGKYIDSSRPYYPNSTSWIRGTTGKYKPSILVLFAGANDLAVTDGEPIPDRSEAGIANFVLSKLKYVVGQARLGSPGIDIVLTTVPQGAASSRFNIYNSKLAALAKSLNTASQRVVVAAIPSWKNYSWDGFHPDAKGEVRIAAAIDDKLRVLNPKLLGRPKTPRNPTVGPRFPAVLRVSATSRSSVDLAWTFPPGADRARIFVRKKGAAWPTTPKADLVLARLRAAYPNDGTATCETRCTAYKVTGLSSSTNYEFRIQIGKGHAVATTYSNVVSAKTSGGLFG